MLTTLPTRLKRASRWLPALLLPFAAQAQTPGYSLSNTANVAGTFTSIAATGTAIATANTDDANSAATPIGFTFNYNGTAFTDFVLNTNGFLRLGTAAPSSAALFYTVPQAATGGPIASTNPADVNLIMPFATDLTAGSVAGTGYQVTTTGAVGSRITTIQWTNVQDKASTIATQFLNFSFQAKLYEGGRVEFVYGPTVPNTVGNDFRYVAVGIKGSTAAASITITKGSTQAWSAASFAAGDYTGNSHNIRQTTTADPGRTYRFGSGAACADPTAATITSTNNTITIGFTPGANNVQYNVTYTTGGTIQTVTPAPTASPVTISGLLPGTIYLVTLQSVCADGNAGAVLRGSASTTGTPPAATYATLPYAESFETTWLNGLGVRDLPSANWRNAPATGDNSWRREDDGASANWSFLGADATPASPYVIRFSTGAHSARFHSYGAGPVPAGSSIQGRLDLYANLSGTSTKTLVFDYINPTGTDKLDVFVSTDGGATFGATPVLIATTNAVFTAKTVTIAGNSATTVIRFQASSDYGDNDIGIDNMRLSVVSATTNAALAATVGLYPNPASRAFTLSVPAGSLRTASATLTNALGQVVQARQLSLPAAGGIATFDVSNLAAGVYSLTLKAGNDLVVKRVVVE